MKRAVYRKMKITKWDRFVEWALANNLSPKDFLDDTSMSKVLNRLSIEKLMNEIEKVLFTSSTNSKGIIIDSMGIGIDAQLKNNQRRRGRKLKVSKKETT